MPASAVIPLPARVSPAAVPATRLLTAAEFHRLADVPPEVEWFANLARTNEMALI